MKSKSQDVRHTVHKKTYVTIRCVPDVCDAPRGSMRRLSAPALLQLQRWRRSGASTPPPSRLHGLRRRRQRLQVLRIEHLQQQVQLLLREVRGHDDGVRGQAPAVGTGLLRRCAAASVLGGGEEAAGAEQRGGRRGRHKPGGCKRRSAAGFRVLTAKPWNTMASNDVRYDGTGSTGM